MSNIKIDCPSCGGSGSIGECYACSGYGYTMTDSVYQNPTCRICGGTGSAGDCSQCGGLGTIEIEYEET